jgi:hypothetical protein
VSTALTQTVFSSVTNDDRNASAAQLGA